MENQIKIGDLCKHFKGHNLIEKNIYEILFLNVIYSGENAKIDINDLVIYRNIFDGKTFAREASDIFSMLSLEKQEEYGQRFKVQKLTDVEVEEVNQASFKVKKLDYIKNK